VPLEANLPISVPWNEKPAESKTLTVPTAPLLKAPGFFQYSKPIVWPPTAPAVTRIPKKK
jgi:hypothetical protein